MASKSKAQGTAAGDLVPETMNEAQGPLPESLSADIVRLMFDEPFWAHVLRGVDMIRTDEVPTAGVLANADGIRMWWNPAFVAELTVKEVKGLLKHEGMHLALDHTTTRRLEPHIIHNWAADLAINSDIPLIELPKMGLIPGRELQRPKPEQWDRMDGEDRERFERLSKLLASLPPGQSTEWYFARLMEDPQTRQDIEGASEEGHVIDLDSHEGWGEGLSEEDREMVKAKIKQTVADAIAEADRTGRWGSVSAETRQAIRASMQRSVDWKSVLRQFCGQSQRADARSTWSRLNRKYAGISPGRKRSYTASIAVYIDQSGSVSSDELQRIFSELGGLADRVEFTTFHFDTSVDPESEQIWKRGRQTEIKRTRSGGTCFDAPTKHVNANKRFDACIIVTDGAAPKPKPSKIKRLWLLMPGTSLTFTPDRRDGMARMDARKGPN
jgi:predicted metal-dependent peptidase